MLARIIGRFLNKFGYVVWMWLLIDLKWVICWMCSNICTTYFRQHELMPLSDQLENFQQVWYEGYWSMLVKVNKFVESSSTKWSRTMAFCGKFYNDLNFYLHKFLRTICKGQFLDRTLDDYLDLFNESIEWKSIQYGEQNEGQWYENVELSREHHLESPYAITSSFTNDEIVPQTKSKNCF